MHGLIYEQSRGEKNTSSSIKFPLMCLQVEQIYGDKLWAFG